MFGACEEAAELWDEEASWAEHASHGELQLSWDTGLGMCQGLESLLTGAAVGLLAPCVGGGHASPLLSCSHRVF